MFIHQTRITPVELNTIEGPDGRFYVTPEGRHYPSITTILGDGEKPWLDEWRESLGVERAARETKRAADRGSAVHDMAEKFLNNVADPTEGHAPEHISDFKRFRLRLNRVNNILTQETALWSDVLRVAGRVDCIGEYDGRLAIIDFKTSTNGKNESQIQDYFLQTTAYALMCEERYGIPIDNVVILMSVEKGAVPMVFKQPIEPYIRPLFARINNYHKKHGEPK